MSARENGSATGTGFYNTPGQLAERVLLDFDLEVREDRIAAGPLDDSNSLTSFLGRGEYESARPSRGGTRFRRGKLTGTEKDHPLPRSLKVLRLLEEFVGRGRVLQPHRAPARDREVTEAVHPEVPVLP